MKNKKINIVMKKKQFILTLIYRQISIKKYVPKHYINLLQNFFYTFCLIKDDGEKMMDKQLMDIERMNDEEMMDKG